MKISRILHLYLNKNQFILSCLLIHKNQNLDLILRKHTEF
jgi:hypothetical protein